MEYYEKMYNLCIKLALKAYKKGEIPVGALVIKDNKVLSKAYNLREKNHDISAHAEIIALKRAANRLKRWNLSDCELIVTLKPCQMCESAIKQSRIKKVHYLAEKLNYKKEYDKTIFEYSNIGGLEDKYIQILKDFFTNKRR